MKTTLPAFDVLLEMARNDPQGLETLRRSLTDAVIEGASTEPRRRRLQGLQFRVDMERERASSPLGATIRISEMMCKSLAELHRSMVESHIGPDGRKQKTDTPQISATVFGFPDGFPREHLDDFEPFQ